MVVARSLLFRSFVKTWSSWVAMCGLCVRYTSPVWGATYLRTSSLRATGWSHSEQPWEFQEPPCWVLRCHTKVLDFICLKMFLALWAVIPKRLDMVTWFSGYVSRAMSPVSRSSGRNGIPAQARHRTVLSGCPIWKPRA